MTQNLFPMHIFVYTHTRAHAHTRTHTVPDHLSRSVIMAEVCKNAPGVGGSLELWKKMIFLGFPKQILKSVTCLAPELKDRTF